MSKVLATVCTHAAGTDQRYGSGRACLRNSWSISSRTGVLVPRQAESSGCRNSAVSSGVMPKPVLVCQLKENTLPLNKHLIVAATVIGGAAVAVALAVRRQARRVEAIQHKADLQAWENEGGSPVRTAATKPQT